MNPLFDDTSLEAEQLLLVLLRQAPPWRRMELQAQMWRTVRSLALCGLRQRFPDAAAEELHRRLADLLLGPEQASMAYPAHEHKRALDAL
jgi:hypothetical protein